MTEPEVAIGLSRGNRLGRGDSPDVSAAKTDTETSDTEAVYESDPGAMTGDTTGDDPHGADDTR